MKNLVIICACATILTSCLSRSTSEKSNATASYFNDFENTIGWAGENVNAQTITKGTGHSGSYYSRVDSLNLYSYMFKAKMKDILPKPVKSVKLSCWAMLKNLNADAKLVVVIDDPAGNHLLWNGISLKELNPKVNEWTEMISDNNIAKYINQDNIVAVYFWNNSKEEVFYDDIKIEFNE